MLPRRLSGYFGGPSRPRQSLGQYNAFRRSSYPFFRRRRSEKITHSGEGSYPQDGGRYHVYDTDRAWVQQHGTATGGQVRTASARWGRTAGTRTNADTARTAADRSDWRIGRVAPAQLMFFGDGRSGIRNGQLASLTNKKRPPSHERHTARRVSAFVRAVSALVRVSGVPASREGPNRICPPVSELYCSIARARAMTARKSPATRT